MYIYYALISALSAHMIHINLNMVFYTYVEHSPIITTHTKQAMERPPPPPPTTMNLNVYNTDLYHTSYMRTHAHTHTMTVAGKRYWY